LKHGTHCPAGRGLGLRRFLPRGFPRFNFVPIGTPSSITIVPSDQEDSPPKPGNPSPARVPATRDTSPSEGQVHDDGIECQDQVDRGPGRGHHNTSRRTRSAGRNALAPLAAPPSPRFTEIRPAAWGHRHRSTRHRTLHRITTGHRLPRREPEQRAPACGTGLAPTGVPDGC
jgi:hypothetical protein